MPSSVFLFNRGEMVRAKAGILLLLALFAAPCAPQADMFTSGTMLQNLMTGGSMRRQGYPAYYPRNSYYNSNSYYNNNQGGLAGGVLFDGHSSRNAKCHGWYPSQLVSCMTNTGTYPRNVCEFSLQLLWA